MMLRPSEAARFFEEANLLLAVPVLVVLQAFVDVFLAPAEHAIDQDGQLVGHRGNRFRCAELVAARLVTRRVPRRITLPPVIRLQ